MAALKSGESVAEQREVKCLISSREIGALTLWATEMSDHSKDIGIRRLRVVHGIDHYCAKSAIVNSAIDNFHSAQEAFRTYIHKAFLSEFEVEDAQAVQADMVRWSHQYTTHSHMFVALYDKGYIDFLSNVDVSDGILCRSYDRFCLQILFNGCCCLVA
jgi:hypothetical protein